jgi:hypothetical protein
MGRCLDVLMKASEPTLEALDDLGCPLAKPERGTRTPVNSMLVSAGAGYYADGRQRKTIPEALAEWLVAIVLLTALSLVGPILVPWGHNHFRKFDPAVSFGKGELLAFAFAILAVAVVRWWLSEGASLSGFWATVFKGSSIFGLGMVSTLIATVWIDDYTAGVNHTGRILDAGAVTDLSYGVTVLALLVGAATEYLYARSLREFVRAGR